MNTTDRDSRRRVRIGGASGFWGDSVVGAPQLVHSGLIDYLVFDYLAETTMAILASARARKPEMGYATDFVDIAMKQVLGEVMRRGIKVVANAGGINPAGCARALRALADAMGLAPRIAVVEGDDVSALMPELRESGTRDMFTAEPLPAQVLSANAYLGALPVAAALAAGADIVITGRCVDSAVTLGVLIHEFGWSADDHDRLAGGSLAGHIIECGCQATGGLFTDWREVADWAHIGYPIIACADDGSFELTKVPGTGGLISRACVAEQLLYEIGDPGAYLLPDVSCDFRQVRIEQTAADRVRVSGALGRAPTGTYKVSATQLDGYRCAGMMVIVGIDAAAKALRTGQAIVERTGEILAAAGFAPYTASHIELLGAETLYGAQARTGATREAMVRVVVDHPHKGALEIFAREIAPSGTSWSPGTTMPAGGRPSPTPLIKPFSFLLDKRRVPVSIQVDAERHGPLAIPAGRAAAEPAASASAPALWTDPAGEAMVEVPLVRLAWARSGDKGNVSNIGLIARRAQWLPLLWDRVTPAVVQRYFAHLVSGRVERFHLPGIAAMNLMLHEALAGGGPASPRFDPLGKGMAQMLLDLPVRVPASIARECEDAGGLGSATLGSALADASAQRGDAAFVLHGDDVTSYRRLDQDSRRVAAGLLRLGLGRGDRIGVLSLNRIEWLAIFFGAARIGAVVVAMSPRYRENELAYMVRDSGVKMIALVAEHEGHDFGAMFDRLAAELPTLRQLIGFESADAPEGEFAAVAGALPRVPYASLLDGAAAGAASAGDRDPVTGDDLAMVIYTSGTTGRPKGAGLTHASLLASARAQAAHMRLGSDDLLPLASPLNHVGGITCGVLSLMVAGGRIDLLPEFKATEVIERIRRHRPTLLAGVPTMMTLLLMKSEQLEIDFSSIRLIFSGGSNVDATLLEQLRQRVPQARLMNLYGLSETSGAIVLTPWHATRDDLMQSIGCVIGDAEVKVVGPSDREPVAPGEVGELCFRGCGVVPGYVGAAAAASGAFLAGGWLLSGDLGRVDERGVITLKGRAKDMYIQGGFNVYPAEVEAFVATHPDVLMVAGIGVADPVLGEIGRYYVVAKPGAQLTEAALRGWCAQGLADYKVPRQIVFRDELPLTPAGKIHKAALRTAGAA